MSDYKSCEAIIAEIQHTMDMQDLYLPVHFIELLNDVPAADVKPAVRGEWLPHGNKPIAFCDFFICSVCHTPQWQLSCYCPSCGADMREG